MVMEEVVAEALAAVLTCAATAPAEEARRPCFSGGGAKRFAEVCAGVRAGRSCRWLWLAQGQLRWVQQLAQQQAADLQQGLRHKSLRLLAA